MDDKKAKAQEALENGGLLAEEDDDVVRLHLAIDPKDPMAVFDRLNEFEIELVKRAGNDLKKIEEAGKFVDDVRSRTKLMLKQVGIDVDALSP